MAFRIAVPDTLAALPLFAGLERDEECMIIRDAPANIGVRYADEPEGFDAALISPLDYARHGGPFRILPGIAVSVHEPPGVSLLRVRPDAISIDSLATGLLSTSDVALTTLLLREKYPPLGKGRKAPTIVPVSDARLISFEKVDAVLEWSASPSAEPHSGFVLDLYEEWMDLTESPLVLGLWVVRHDADHRTAVAERLLEAARTALADLSACIRLGAERFGLEDPVVEAFFLKHSYRLTHEHLDAIDTLFRVAYAHGMIGDVPDLLFLDPTESGDA